MVGVVGGQHDAEAGLGELSHLLQNPHLVAEIKACGGFVHDDDRGILGERAGNQGELALPPLIRVNSLDARSPMPS